MKFAYKLVFILFGMSAIFSANSISGSGVRRTQTKYLEILVNLLISVFNAYEAIYFYIYYNLNLTFIATNVTTNVICTVIRFRLLIRLNELKIASKFISRIKVTEGIVSKLCFYSWMALSILSHALKFIILVTYFNGQRDFISKLFGIEEENIFYNLALSFYAYHTSVLMRFPPTAFAIFFVLVCNHVRGVLKRISRKLSDKTYVDHQKLMNSLSFVKMTINFLDDELSFFMLCETIYTSSEVMYAVSSILHYHPSRHCLSCSGPFSFIIIIISTLIIFVAMCASACLVSEAYRDLWTQVKTLIVNFDTNANGRELKFLLCVEKRVHFTVWKILPINRSFVLCTFGAIFTYIMLFNNLIYSREYQILLFS